MDSNNVPEDVFALGDNDNVPMLDEDEVVVVDGEQGQAPVSIRGGRAPRQMILNWSNIQDGVIKLLPKDYKFPVLPLNNFIIMWYCGQKADRIPPYRMLSYRDVKGMVGGKQKLCNMKKMAKYVEEAANRIGRSELASGPQYTVPKAVALYNAIEFKFRFNNIKLSKKRRFETIGWKTFYNIMAKNGSLYADEINTTES